MSQAASNTFGNEIEYKEEIYKRVGWSDITNHFYFSDLQSNVIFYKPAWINDSHFNIPLAAYRFIFAYRNESRGDVCWVIWCLNSLSVYIYIYLYFYNIYIYVYTHLYMYVYLYMATHIKWAYIPWNSLWFRILKVYSCHFRCFRMGIVHCHLFLSHFSILQLYFHDLLLSEISRALTCLYQTIWLITRSTQHQRHGQTVFRNLDGIRRGLTNETEPLGVVFIVF